MRRDLRRAIPISGLRRREPQLSFAQVIAFLLLTPHPGPLPLGYVFSATFTDVPFVGNFVGNFVGRAFADKVCDKVSDNDGMRRGCR